MEDVKEKRIISHHWHHSVACHMCDGHSLVSAAGARMRSVLAAEECGVTQAAVVGIHVDLCSHTAGLAKLCAFLHLLPHLHVLLHSCCDRQHVQYKSHFL